MTVGPKKTVLREATSFVFALTNKDSGERRLFAVVGYLPAVVTGVADFQSSMTNCSVMGFVRVSERIRMKVVELMKQSLLRWGFPTNDYCRDHPTVILNRGNRQLVVYTYLHSTIVCDY